jgi:hypothetical protein
MSRESWQWHLTRTPATIEYLQACIAARLNASWVKEGMAAKIPVEALQTLQATDVPPRYVPCAVRVCTSGTVVDCDAARSWYIAGVSPRAAASFIKSGVGPEVALAWLRGGFLPEEAIQQIQNGISVGSAKLETTKIKFSDAFRRKSPTYYLIRRKFEVRVQTAVDILDVPSGGDGGGMFSSSTRRVAFLDGGYVATEGYGFGSHSGTGIIGQQALLLICNRIGVSLPRGASPSPSADDLEAMLSDQRLNHWSDLVAQARRPGFVVRSEVSG